jgi:hypothetical protein
MQMSGCSHLIQNDQRRRTVQETVAQITRQYHTAALGVIEDLEQLYTSSGVKDETALRWQGELIKRTKAEQHLKLVNQATREPRLNSRLPKEERARIVARIKQEIQKDQLDWLYTQPVESYEHLSPDSRECLSLACSVSFSRPLSRAPWPAGW